MALGAGLGIALAANPVAGADAIDDAWPYLVPSTPVFPYYLATGLPDPADESYTEQVTLSSSPYLFGEEHQVVTALLDGSAFPHVGTVEDDVALFPIVPDGIGAAPLFTNSYLDDPVLGYADSFGVLNVVQDTYFSDAAGVKDVLSIFGLPPLALFEIPATDSGAAASDLSQVMTEFSTLF
jgi:hypothetical protein